MEAPYNNNNSRVSILKDFKGNVSPLNTQRDNNNHQFFISGGRFHHPISYSPTFDPYASSIDKTNLEKLDPSTVIRYLRSVSPASPDHLYSNSSGGGSGGFGSPLSPLRAVENFETPPSSRSPPVFKTPVKVEEDVLVMDGILLGGSVSGGRMRLSVSSDSVGSSSSGSNSGYKKELCHSWEDSSYCRHGSKCQLAHGKEEVRPSRFPSKKRSDKKNSEICKSYSGLGSCSYGAKCHFSHHQVVTASSPIERAVETMEVEKTPMISPIKPENSNDSASSSSSSINVTNTDWSPMDDNIVVSLPSSASANEIPSREAVDAYINSVLYGPPCGKRLPVFVEICPE